jgi:hypothetical protein
MVGLLRDWLAGAYFTGDNHGQSKEARSTRKKNSKRAAPATTNKSPLQNDGLGCDG